MLEQSVQHHKPICNRKRHSIPHLCFCPPIAFLAFDNSPFIQPIMFFFQSIINSIICQNESPNEILRRNQDEMFVKQKWWGSGRTLLSLSSETPRQSIELNDMITTQQHGHSGNFILIIHTVTKCPDSLRGFDKDHIEKQQHGAGSCRTEILVGQCDSRNSLESGIKQQIRNKVSATSNQFVQLKNDSK